MPRRHGRKTGSIQPRGKDKWLIRWFVGRNAAGKRKYTSKMIHGTFKQAQIALGKQTAAHDDGVALVPTKQTLATYLHGWLRDTKAVEVAPATLVSYTNRLNPDIIDRIGHLKLTAVTPQGIQKVYAALRKDGLSPRTVQYTHTILKDALKTAVAHRLLPFNPCDSVSVPRKRHTELQIWTPEQVNHFLEVTEGTRDHTFWCLALSTGMRPGEICGLKWSDLEKDRLVVRRAITMGKKKGDWRVVSPKTDRGQRSIPLTERALEALREHKKEQRKEIMKGGPKYDRQDWIFANRYGHHEIQTNIRVRFATAVRKADLPSIRLYDCRHTHATLLLQAGVNPKVVSERLGHASIVMTLDTYSHVLPTMQESAVKRLELLMAAAEGGTS
jgi:integrase